MNKSLGQIAAVFAGNREREMSAEKILAGKGWAEVRLVPGACAGAQSHRL